jgi:glyoxylate reductase
VPRVLVTSPLPIDVAPLLGAHQRVGGDRRLTRDELLDAVADVEGLIPLLLDRIDEELLARAPRLRVVANFAVGVDNIDLAACARRGVAVCNTPDVLTDATADLAMALVLAAARRVVEGDALVRAGAWRGWEPSQLLGLELAGSTMGIIGAGRIGRAVARRAEAFGMRVITTRPTPLDELLAVADVVSLHVPLTPATRGLIGARELALMKRGAILVNTARGASVDEAALAAALDSGHLGGAGLDVYAREPEVPEALRRQPRAVLLPHLGSATERARARMATLAATGARDVLDGKTPPNLVARP